MTGVQERPVAADRDHEIKASGGVMVGAVDKLRVHAAGRDRALDRLDGFGVLIVGARKTLVQAGFLALQVLQRVRLMLAIELQLALLIDDQKARGARHATF